MKEIIDELENNNYDYALAFATKYEIEVNAACGQLGLIND